MNTSILSQSTRIQKTVCRAGKTAGGILYPRVRFCARPPNPKRSTYMNHEYLTARAGLEILKTGHAYAVHAAWLVYFSTSHISATMYHALPAAPTQKPQPSCSASHPNRKTNSSHVDTPLIFSRHSHTRGCHL